MRRLAPPLVAVVLIVAGCTNDSPSAPAAFDLAPPTETTDLGTPPGEASDMTVAPPDLSSPGSVDLASPADLGPPGPIGVRVVGGGDDVLDVSIDQGGGLWWVTSARVAYLPPGRTAPFTYNQSNGLARGWTTWVDDWFQNPNVPTTMPVTFSAVGGATPGQAIVGNIGAIADRLEVDPATGAILRLDNMQVDVSSGNVEKLEQRRRVVATLVVAVDLNGTWSGTAYLGGYHGISAFHGLTGDCGCLAFEQHTHFINDQYLAGSSVRAFDFTSDGDLWSGDRKMASLLYQRSRGATASLFESFGAGVDVWPPFTAGDDITGVAVDARGSAFIASSTNGLARLDAPSYAPTYVTMPSNDLTGATFDRAGDLWIGSASSGLYRYRPSTGTFTRYTTADGLPSNTIRRVHADTLTPAGSILVGTRSGAAIITP